MDARPILGPRGQGPSLTTVARMYFSLAICAPSSPLTTIAWYRRDQILSSSREPADLPREVGVHIAHETRELVGVVDVEQEVVVGGDEIQTRSTDFVEPLGSSEDADDDLVELPDWAGGGSGSGGFGR